MKTFLLSIFALAIVTGPVLGEEEKDQPKPPKKNPPPQRQVNPAPRPVTPRVQNNVGPKPQFQPQNRAPVTTRTYAPPKSYTPEVQARLRNKSPRFTPVDQDAPRTTVRTDTNLPNSEWRNSVLAPHHFNTSSAHVATADPKCPRCDNLCGFCTGSFANHSCNIGFRWTTRDISPTDLLSRREDHRP